MVMSIHEGQRCFSGWVYMTEEEAAEQVVKDYVKENSDDDLR